MTGFTTKQYADRRRPPWLWPVVALAAVVVVAVVVGFSLSGGGGHPAAAQQPGPAPTSAGSAPAGGGDSGGTHQPIDPTYLTAAPAGLRFQDVDGLTLPFSPVDGPLRINGPIAAGYSHTPQGAVIAMMQLLPRLAFGPGYRAVITEQVVADQKIKDQMLTSRSSNPQGSPADLAAQTKAAVGFRVESYTSDRATIALLYRDPGSGGFSAARGFVVWDSGDWKWPDNSASTSSPVPDSTGYTLF